MSLHKMVNHLFSVCMIHSRKLHFTFLLHFFKAYLPFLQGIESNKQNTTYNIHRLPKIQFQFYIEEETSPQSFFSYLEVKLGHVQSGLSASKTANKLLESLKSDHVGLRYLKVDVVMGVKLAKKSGKKVTRGWQKMVSKKLQKGDKVAMIINLATD